MIEVKEIRNTENGKDFISKDYLRREAIDYINHCSEGLTSCVIEKKSITENEFSSLNGLVFGYSYIGILTREEANRFMDVVLDAMYNKEGFSAYMYPCGLITLRYIGK